MTPPRAVLPIAALLALSACGDDRPPEPQGPDPLDAVREILRLHDLEGRQPEERSPQAREREVDRAALSRLVADLDARDPFLSDLYVGFVVGALARHQTRLFVSRMGNRAEVSAGDARIVLVLDGGRWKILLGDSVPDEIERRAAQEKRRYEEALRGPRLNPPPG